MSEQDLLSVDAEYLLRYIEIQDDFINASLSVGGAREKLAALNEEYKDKISSGALQEAINTGPVYEDDDWMPSDIC